MKLFGSSGIRRVVDSTFLDLLYRVSLVVGKKYRRVVVGCDSRTTSPEIKRICLAGLLHGGSDAYDAGMVPTPTLAVAARHFDAGLMVTASHNPSEYNGVKLINPDGSAFSMAQQKEIEDSIDGHPLTLRPPVEFVDSHEYEGAVEEHIKLILSQFPRFEGIKVVLDCDNGAACAVTPELLARWGVRS